MALTWPQHYPNHVTLHLLLLSWQHNSTISIETNFATFDEITLVESIKYNLKWSKNGPDMAPI